MTFARLPVLFRIVTSICVLVPGNPTAGEPPSDVPELAVLGSWVGEWTTEMSLIPSDPAQPSRELKGSASATWMVDGRFVRQEWRIHAAEGISAVSGTTIMGYDEPSKTYRSWWFFSDGNTMSMTGIWDAASRKMTWTGEGSDMATTTVEAAFPEKSLEKWSIVFRDRAGKVNMRSEGTNKRRTTP